jgi:large subunit ribosomal protein L21
MYAVIKTGGKQYRVKSGDELVVEKLAAEKGQEIVFEEVLALGEGDALTIGAPRVEGARVSATVVTQGKARKVIVFKKKRRKGYKVKRGHRQQFTRVKITEISA